MKNISILILLLFTGVTSNAQKNFVATNHEALMKPAVEAVVQDIEITYNNADVCGLTCLGTVKVVEKRFWYCNSPLKESTKAELQRLASEKGGDIVFVNINQTRGWALIFSTTYEGFVYKK